VSRFKDYFTFNHAERRGIFALSIILFMIILSPFVFRYLHKDKPVDFSGFEKDIATFEKTHTDDSDSLNKTSKNKSFILFDFDPNHLPEEQWKALGLSERQIKVIKNFESKGGKFYKKDDLKKIYSISHEDFARLEPFIKIASSDSLKNKKYNSFYKKKIAEYIEINAADTLNLLKIKGISPWLARNIIKYRSLLGGFYRKEQLLEVYHLDTAKYLWIADYLKVDTNLVKKININNATFRQLNYHPYIKYDLASFIINYRQKHGRFKDIDELKKESKMSSDKYERVRHYLSFN